MLTVYEWIVVGPKEKKIMIKASDKVRYAIKNMILKNDTDNQQMLWWMLWGMMTISERKDWRIISRYQDRYTRSKFIDGEI